VLVPDPGYAPYTMGAMLVGAEVATLPLLEVNGFLPDLDAVPELSGLARDDDVAELPQQSDGRRRGSGLPQ
jgi:histidinol-phosphate/aromatic aminotransferase/cobyric acid decarboxylase-like protein